jgi:dienelactone hydrolase
MTKKLASFLFLTLTIQWVVYADELTYMEDNWNAFIKKHTDDESVNQETLCKTEKGRDVEMLHIGKGRFRIFVSARHDAGDAIGNFVIEGMLDEILSEKNRHWFLHKTNIVVIPFVDKDGVEDKAHGTDYSARYGDEGISTTEATQEFLKTNWEMYWPSMIVDLHANDVRNPAQGVSFVGKPYEAVDVDTDWHWQQTGRFSRNLAGTIKGELKHDPADNVAWNEGWNKAQKTDEVNLIEWTACLTSLRFATRLEVPTTATAETARELGRSLAKALKKDIEGRKDAISQYKSKRARMGAQVILPDSYKQNPERKYPMIVDVRGNFEFGVPHYALDTPAFPFIVVQPLPVKWEGGGNRAYLTEAYSLLIDEICQEYRADKERIYLTGLSIGGYGTWEMAMLHPEKFAAVARVAGYGKIEGLENIKELPAWAIQGAIDHATRPAAHTQTVDALKKLGGKVKYSLVEGLSHDAFRYAFHQPDLYEWFLHHTNPGIAPVEPGYKDVKVVTLKSLVVPESEKTDGKEAQKAVHQFCVKNGLGSESGIRYFADRS